jgi:hypothetical protein
MLFKVSVAVLLTSATTVSASFQDAILAEHNTARCKLRENAVSGQPKASSLPDLTWDSQLASDAQAWAEHLAVTGDLVHDSTLGGTGENLYSFWSSGDTCADVFFAEDSVQRWFAEHLNYDYASHSSTNGEAVGHYTQVVNVATTEVGCGIKTAIDGYTYVVCRYKSGNVLPGAKPYVAGSVTGSEDPSKCGESSEADYYVCGPGDAGFGDALYGLYKYSGRGCGGNNAWKKEGTYYSLSLDSETDRMTLWYGTSYKWYYCKLGNVAPDACANQWSYGFWESYQGMADGTVVSKTAC